MKWGKLTKLLCICLASVVVYCEFLMYYVVFMQCKWPSIHPSASNLMLTDPVKAVIIADTHLLGPVHGHWFDKLVREWHMHRAFQTAVTVFRPDVIFILGDVFDEGHLVSDEYFLKYILRYHTLFYPSGTTKVISIVGNHDVGFHYQIAPFYINRFKKEFNNTGVHLHSIKNVHFVFINSMAMENDQCALCREAQRDLLKVGQKLMCMKDPKYHNCPEPQKDYSRPILMQHFPTYRISDAVCEEHDSPKIQRYRENWDVLSKESTKIIGRTINPRLALSGHSHHFCKLKNSLGIEEYTVASFSWRNKINPSFLIGQFTPNDYGISKCDMPVQDTYVAIYISALVICVTAVTLNFFNFLVFKLKKQK